MSRTWSLLGLAIRIALSQGLHREPSLFPSNMDGVQVEIRRRLWHHICYLDFRSAESKGQDPTIKDEDYTTLLPRNVNDEDLEGSTETISPGFTDMSGQLIRLRGVHCYRRILRSTSNLERHIKSSSPESINPVTEYQSLFNQVRDMVEEMATLFQTQYLQYCDLQIPSHRFALGFAAVIEWRCWSLIWMRTPKQYREAVISPEIRQTYHFALIRYSTQLIRSGFSTNQSN